MTSAAEQGVGNDGQPRAAGAGGQVARAVPQPGERAAFLEQRGRLCRCRPARQPCRGLLGQCGMKEGQLEPQAVRWIWRGRLRQQKAVQKKRPCPPATGAANAVAARNTSSLEREERPTMSEEEASVSSAPQAARAWRPNKRRLCRSGNGGGSLPPGVASQPPQQ